MAAKKQVVCLDTGVKEEGKPGDENVFIGLFAHMSVDRKKSF
jgi:hypothetical protein